MATSASPPQTSSKSGVPVLSASSRHPPVSTAPGSRSSPTTSGRVIRTDEIAGTEIAQDAIRPVASSVQKDGSDS
ncbi:hypothetical protein Ato02nite_042070 [Paractinoplanes toevensis]|uniref:Uncharacterized protein n=1 Tax=Paractinoplanes toevensis TaxID=571911 RepID=A0A919TDZ0_9ACTN|nr:hypothetical protein Ato02nite_042070 [Actinoplanes toevensis]